MIRFALACDEGHEFESWFPSGASFDEQIGRGLVTCPACGSPKVEKRLMAPAIAKGGSPGRREDADRAAEPAAAPSDRPEPAAPPVPQALALLSERDQAMRAMLRAVREHVTKTADYVGPSFAEEARRMHHGEIEHRSIYGEANALEARALLEDGIEVHPLPVLPDDRN